MSVASAGSVATATCRMHTARRGCVNVCPSGCTPMKRGSQQSRGDVSRPRGARALEQSRRTAQGGVTRATRGGVSQCNSDSRLQT
jgi:hypothetical protein